jgi:hypothetical protein
LPTDALSLVVSGIEIYLSLESLLNPAVKLEYIQAELTVFETQIKFKETAEKVYQ